MFLLPLSNRRESFCERFRIDAAADDVLRDAVYRIRHEVYCEEMKYEPERPDRLETDAYDAHSVHCLLSTADAPHARVGCTRLILANPADADAPLPFERVCWATLDRSIIDPAKLPRERIGEVSRLAVRKSYRVRKGERRCAPQLHESDLGAKDHPRFLFITVGLYLGAISLAAHNGIDVLFVLTEPRLANHFSRLGVDIRQIGGPILHRGTRVPSVIDVQSVIRGMRIMLKPLWGNVHAAIGSSIQSSSLPSFRRGAGALVSAPGRA